MSRTGIAGGSTRRGRGSRAGIDRDRIVEIARSIEPSQLTMKAVADRLGVDRKALHHHVTDRESLMSLVAATNFELSCTVVDLHEQNWRVLSEQYARQVRSGMIATGAFIDYYRFDPAPDHPSFAAVEAILVRLLDVGFSEATAGRTLVTLTNLAMSSARDVLLGGANQVHPQTPEIQRAFQDLPRGAYSTLRRLIENRPVRDSDEQFDFDLRLIFVGLERELQLEMSLNHAGELR